MKMFLSTIIPSQAGFAVEMPLQAESLRGLCQIITGKLHKNIVEL
jgi:hypothetical protein